MKIMTIGNALVDLLVILPSDAVLKKLNLIKGSMQLIDEHQRAKILQEVKAYPQKLVSGGSAANTAVGMGRLGMDVTYVGAIGLDDLGEFFKKDMEKQGVKTLFESYPTPTGVSIVLVSPDGERTFATYLGAALSLSENIFLQSIHNENFDCLYVEGYLVDNEEFLTKIIHSAVKRNIQIAIDLANFAVVEAKKAYLQHLIESYINIVFANNEECVAYCHATPTNSVNYWQKLPVLAVLKMGKEGSMVVRGEEVIHVPAYDVQVVDTTGAGDLFAAGFMYGLSHGWPLQKCLTVGNLLASEVIQVIGAKLTEEMWEKIKKLIRE